MDNITKDMFRFKEALRHNWNTYFLDLDSPKSTDRLIAFETIERELFRTLILDKRGASAEADNYHAKPSSKIAVRPRQPLTEIPIQFGKHDANHNMVWELPVVLKASEVSHYYFIDFFDWNPYGHIDLAYIRAWDRTSNRTALIAQMYCDFEFQQ